MFSTVDASRATFVYAWVDGIRHSVPLDGIDSAFLAQVSNYPRPGLVKRLVEALQKTPWAGLNLKKSDYHHLEWFFNDLDDPRALNARVLRAGLNPPKLQRWRAGAGSQMQLVDAWHVEVLRRVVLDGGRVEMRPLLTSDFEGQSVEQVAKAMGVTASAVMRECASSK